jgi:D-3-phosphoglycerate dehydrogenase
MKILANDGIDAIGKAAIEALGCEVHTNKIAQHELIAAIQKEQYAGLLVRSATTARKDLIDACPSLKFIGRGGVGIDNIDAEYARSKGITVFNTPASSSQAVAELVMACIFAAARGIYDAGKNMRQADASQFEALKKQYSKGFELKGKTLGIVGLGRIGKSLAEYAIGCGMKVIACDRNLTENATLTFSIGAETIQVTIPVLPLNELLSSSDIVSIHVPKQPGGAAVIGKDEFLHVKKGAVLVNTSRGGVIDEKLLLQHLNDATVRAACLDVFDGEPHVNPELLSHPAVICTPHIGAATLEAQARIGLEIAENIKSILASI